MIVTRLNLVSILLAMGASLTVARLASGEDNPYAPQPQSSLQKMLSIDWKLGPDLPQGMQDSGVGIVNGTLVTAGGFFYGPLNDVPGKKEKYPDALTKNVFFNKTWGLSLASPRPRWESLPDRPGVARQGAISIAVNDQLYGWGGLNFTAPYTYKDGYRLTNTGGSRSWSSLPDLPWNLYAGGISAIGSKIYIVGGSDYNADAPKPFYTDSDRVGNVKRLGARLLVFDTKNLSAGWKELTACPGTPRMTPAMAAVGGKLYLFGGCTGNDNSTGSSCTVVDNWQYDPTANAWQRLQDLPVASGNFTSGQIVFDNRYLLLIGGYQYNKVLAPDGSARPLYGTPFQHYPNHPYYSDVWVYDTKLSTFGVATPLPLNNNTPMTVVEGNRVLLIGGETGGAVLEGVHFGHHPDLYLVGTIREIDH